MAGRVGGTEQPDWDSAMQLFPMGCSPVCTLLLPAAPTVLTAPVRLVGSPCDLPVSAPKHVAECRHAVSASIGCCSSALHLLLLLVPAPLVAPPPCHVCVSCYKDAFLQLHALQKSDTPCADAPGRDSSMPSDQQLLQRDLHRHSLSGRAPRDWVLQDQGRH